ncbi:HAD family hydrolase [bacterium]|nr:HAD family hydrolase [bacterium]
MLHSHTQTKFVFFSIDQTLYDAESAIQAALLSCRLRLEELYGELPDYWNVEYLRRLQQQVLLEGEPLGNVVHSTHRESLRRALLTLGLPALTHLNELDRLYTLVRYHPRWFYPDTISTLRYLNRRYSLGVISNGVSFLEILGIEHLFAFQMYTRQLPWKKPDPRIFELIDKHSGNVEDELLFIGDDPRTDIHCARLRKIPAIWINRKELSYPRNLLSPTKQASNLSSLRAWL